jgi:branched-chain amino acid aminotransferase
MELCREMDIEVQQRPILPEEINTADSAFFCGTAAEVIGIASINDHVFPKAWHDTKGSLLQKAYKSLVTGKDIYTTTAVAEKEAIS